MQAKPSSNDLPLMIGPYKILEKLGQGGMGEVFKVYDPLNKRTVALKRILLALQKDKKKQEHFLNEVRLTRQLSHPAIIPIYSFVEERDLLYYTMPYIEGSTLKSILEKACQRAQEGIPEEANSSVHALAPLFLQICQAVSYAHSKGIIHRDLKPSNIMVGAQSEVYLLDWGLVTALEKNEGSISPQSTAGTLPYLAPELVQGSPLSYQAEIYTLGLILYQMLTLRYPFHREDVEKYCKNLIPF